MTELSSGAEIADASAAPAVETGDGPDYGEVGPGTGYDSGADAFAAQAELPPRHESEPADQGTDESADPDDDFDDDAFAAAYDGDLDALAGYLPARHESQPAARPDSTEADTEADEADPDAEADWVTTVLASEAQLPARHEPGTAARSDAPDVGEEGQESYSGDPDTEYDGDVSALLPAPESTESVPAPETTAAAGDGQDAPVTGLTVEYLPPEARTIGDTTPTGIGRKPTGEEFLDMESDDPAESRIDKLLNRANEHADDLRDTISNTGETIHELRLPGPHAGGGHAHEGQVAHEGTPPVDTTAFSDVLGGSVIAVVALATGIRLTIQKMSKRDRK